MMETLPAKIETNLDNTPTIPLDAVLPSEVSSKLAAVIEKWGSYIPAVVTDSQIRETEYKDYSARKKLIKAIEAKQKIFNQPVKALLDQVNQSFKAAVIAITGANERSEKVIRVYDDEAKANLERQRREQQAILDAEAEAERARLAAKAEAERIFDNEDKAIQIEKKIESVKPMIAGLPEVEQEGERTTWHHEVVDPSLVPEIWWKPRELDEVKIRRDVQSAQSGSKGEIRINIPGVRVYSKTSLAGSR